ncbi:MAG: Secretion system C-terminal sorting domain [Bacteroidota bacterium]
MGSNEQAEVSVYNTMGQLVFSEKTMTTPGTNTYRLNTSNLPVGNYVARLVSGKNVAEKLIQVQH